MDLCGTSSILPFKLHNTFNAFNEALKKYPKHCWVLSFSGGKDSTFMTLLFKEWIDAYNNVIDELQYTNIYILHNDTLGEVYFMESWARSFGREITKYLNERGLKAEFHITKPDIIDTFYWRMIVRGYPAPTFKFRWCVNLLKLDPTRKFIHRAYLQSGKPVILFSGVRLDESPARSGSIKRRQRGASETLVNSGCPMRCHMILFQLDAKEKYIIKYAPILHWREDEVWKYLYEKCLVNGNLEILFKLYGIKGFQKVLAAPARYGCWHCTMVSRHYGIFIAMNMFDKKYLYLECGRLLLKLLSDISELREKKNWGYSKLGPLNVFGKSLVLKLLIAIEEFSQTKLYGLDESYLTKLGKITLRDIFYRFDPTEANKFIKILDDSDRVKNFDIEKVRKAKLNQELISKIKDHVNNEFRGRNNVLIQGNVESEIYLGVKEMLDHILDDRSNLL